MSIVTALLLLVQDLIVSVLMDISRGMVSSYDFEGGAGTLLFGYKTASFVRIALLMALGSHISISCTPFLKSLLIITSNRHYCWF